MDTGFARGYESALVRRAGAVARIGPAASRVAVLALVTPAEFGLLHYSALAGIRLAALGAAAFWRPAGTLFGTHVFLHV